MATHALRDLESKAASRTSFSRAEAERVVGCPDLVSVGVLVLAPQNLSAVADALERHYGSTLVAGVAGQLALAPVLAGPKEG